ncbi:hypothetical protein CYMTET_5710 [Cymbomonas tetramitiformis]|uniref:Uncharacterized protein n=1 Tax=Cymbomonas tetramitiformis TaxID=36881 RepID=A0AAE0GZ28_9CHLO|nr:hypothetical protein CYMTET_5710 [Cymbomonas tetramitiformis]
MDPHPWPTQALALIFHGYHSTRSPSSKMSSQAVYVSLSLLSLVCLTGAGVAVGTGVAMMSMDTAKDTKAAPAAASPKESFKLGGR